MAKKPVILDTQTLPDTQVLSDGSVLLSHGQVAGETIAQWTQDWWTWALQTPAATSPMLDQTGAFAGVNNTGDMFFIGGSFGGDVVRTFDVPANTPLLVPVLNNLAFQFTGKGPDPATGGKGAANIVTTDLLKSVSDVFLNIDGHPVGNLQADLVRTDWFSPGVVQPGSLADSFGLTGDLGPAKSIGYWTAIEGFAAGSTHVLDFGGTAGGVSVHITDTIKVGM